LQGASETQSNLFKILRSSARELVEASGIEGLTADDLASLQDFKGRAVDRAANPRFQVLLSAATTADGTLEYPFNPPLISSPSTLERKHDGFLREPICLNVSFPP
jgi:hypothetical protein